MIKTIFEEREDIGEARCVARGKAEGKAEAGGDMVLTVRRARFKKIPKDVEKAILAITDSIALKSWTV